jgi:hypothetical protein
MRNLFYADSGVDYFDQICDRDFIRDDIAQHDAKSPVRSFGPITGLEFTG